jgi:hypothetical protein
MHSLVIPQKDKGYHKEVLSIVLEVRFHIVSLATSISVLIWAFLLQKPHIDASRTMSSAITKPMILPLDGINY